MIRCPSPPFELVAVRASEMRKITNALGFQACAPVFGGESQTTLLNRESRRGFYLLVWRDTGNRRRVR